MIETYFREQKARTEFLKKTQEGVVEALGHPTVQEALGPMATSLSTLAEGMYIPDISKHGMVGIPVAKRGSDALPVMALRDGEQVVRDASFAGFTPQQLRTTPDTLKRYFQTVCKRTEALPQEQFVASMMDPTAASARRMVYRIPEFPEPAQSTYFNMRPLLLLQYPESGVPLGADKVGTALSMVNFVMENAVVTAPDSDGFDLMNADWSLQSEATAAAIQAIPQQG